MSKPAPNNQNLVRMMRLACGQSGCDYRPDPAAHMTAVEHHYQQKHPGEELRLDLAVFCPNCDVRMDLQRTQPRRDTFHCPQCGLTGYVAKVA